MVVDYGYGDYRGWATARPLWVSRKNEFVSLPGRSDWESTWHRWVDRA